MLFTFPSRYLFTIGHSVVLSLGSWSTHFQTEFLVLRPTQKLCNFLLVRDYHPLRSDFPDCSDSLCIIYRLVLDFLSCRYLDVSVPCVRSHYTILFVYEYHSRGGFPHSDIRGSMSIHNSPRLFAVYHVLLRL